MYCTQCGTKLEDTALFCSQCGHRVNRKPIVENEIPEEIVTPEIIPENNSVSSESEKSVNEENSGNLYEQFPEPNDGDISQFDIHEDDSQETTIEIQPVEAPIEVASAESLVEEPLFEESTFEEGYSSESPFEESVPSESASEESSFEDSYSASEQYFEKPVFEKAAFDETVSEEPEEEKTPVDTKSSFSDSEYSDTESQFDDEKTVRTPFAEQMRSKQTEEPIQPKRIQTIAVEQPENTPKKQKRGFGAHLLTTVLCILLAVFLFATIAVSVVKKVLDSDTITAMLSNIELSEVKVDDLADKDELIEMGLRVESDNVMNIIYDNINQDALADPLTKREFEKIINNDAFSKYIGELLGKRFVKLSKGKSTDIITIKDICNFLEDEKDEIADIIGYEITPRRIENLRVTLENNYGDVFESLENKTLDSFVGKSASSALMIVFSDWLLIVLIVIDVLFVCLIFLVIRSVKLGCNYSGATLIIIGLLFTVFALMILFGFLSLFVSGIIAEIITQSISVVLWDLIIISVSVLFGGVILIVIGQIVNKIINKRSAKNV